MEEQLPSLGVRGLFCTSECWKPSGQKQPRVCTGDWGAGGGIAACQATGATFNCAAVFSTASYEWVDTGLFILGRFCS